MSGKDPQARADMYDLAATQSREAYQASITRSPDAERLAKLAAATYASLSDTASQS